MDRVLIVADDIQYVRHLENTLRKVGFDVESINNEFKLSETLLSYNPDYVICKGTSNRLTTLNLGKRLKEGHQKFSGKVILVLPKSVQVNAEELIKVKMDMLLVEPISTLSLVVNLFSLSKDSFENVKERLLKFVNSDQQFKNFEQLYLKDSGLNFENEIQVIKSMQGYERKDSTDIFSLEPSLLDREIDQNQPKIISEGLPERIEEEMVMMRTELPLRIDTYNRHIKDIDQDLKKGLNKRQTKAKNRELRQILEVEKGHDKKNEDTVNKERLLFTKALFKKK